MKTRYTALMAVGLGLIVVWWLTSRAFAQTPTDTYNRSMQEYKKQQASYQKQSEDYEKQQATFQKQSEDYEKQLAEYTEIMKRYTETFAKQEDFIKRYEKDLDRFEKILATHEKQQVFTIVFASFVLAAVVGVIFVVFRRGKNIV